MTFVWIAIIIIAVFLATMVVAVVKGSIDTRKETIERQLAQQRDEQNKRQEYAANIVGFVRKIVRFKGMYAIWSLSDEQCELIRDIFERQWSMVSTTQREKLLTVPGLYFTPEIREGVFTGFYKVSKIGLFGIVLSVTNLQFLRSPDFKADVQNNLEKIALLVQEYALYSDYAPIFGGYKQLSDKFQNFCDTKEDTSLLFTFAFISLYDIIRAVYLQRFGNQEV